MGMPNVGKSTMINAIKVACLKGHKVAKTGPLPGVTRHVSGFKVCSSPNTYVIDSPGIMIPRIEKEENEKGLKLALVGCIRESIVGEELIADYLLYTLNKFQEFSYVSMFNMKQPSDNIDIVLTIIANRIGTKNSDGTPNHLIAARYFLAKYREGTLGKLTLDSFVIIQVIYNSCLEICLLFRCTGRTTIPIFVAQLQ